MPQKVIVGGIVLLAVGIFLVTLTRAVWYPSPDIGTFAPSSGASAIMSTSTLAGPAEEPAQLSIPVLRIQAKVQYIGLTKVGNIGIPNNFTDVAWYKYGTMPGQVGDAIIDGHVDNAIALPGVFKHLDQIKVGNDVIVQTVKGTRLHFIVTSVQAYPYDAVPMAKILAENDAPYLTLITCGGTWIQAVKSYDKRLVVTTKLAGLLH